MVDMTVSPTRQRLLDAGFTAVQIDTLTQVLDDNLEEWVDDAIHRRCVQRSHSCKRGACYQFPEPIDRIGWSMTSLRLLGALNPRLGKYK